MLLFVVARNLFFGVIMSKLCQSQLSIPQQQLINAVSANLLIKHCIIIKDSSSSVGPDSLLFSKFLSVSKISFSYLTTDEMLKSMHNHYFESKELDPFTSHKYDKVQFGYLPKTVVLLFGNDNLKNLHRIFQPNYLYGVSKYIWMIFDIEDEASMKKINETQIPYDCEFFVIKKDEKSGFNIFEIYKIQLPSFNSQIVYFGSWNENDEFKKPNTDFYERRLNMNNTLVPVVAYYLPKPCKFFGEIYCLHTEIIEEMSRTMNFRIFFASMDDIEKFGIAITLEGPKLFEIFIVQIIYDFTNFKKFIIGPLWERRAWLYVAYRRSYEDNYSSFLRPFSPNLWTAVASYILVTGFFIRTTEYFVGRIIPLKRPKKYVLLDGLFCSLENFLNQCGSEIPNDLFLLRIIRFIIRFVALFIVPAYSGAIFSYLIFPTVSLPFTNLKEFAEDGSYKITFDNYSDFDFRFSGLKDDLSKNIYDNFFVDMTDRPQNIQEGMDRICLNPKLSFLTYQDSLSTRRCKLLSLPKPIYVAWEAMILRQDSPYVKIMNRILKNFRSSGILQKMKKNIFSPEHKYEDMDENTLELEDLFPLFRLILFIYLFSAVLLIVEHLYFYIKKLKS